MKNFMGTNSARREGVSSMSNIPELFGSLVFDDAVQQKRLPHETYRRLREIIRTG